ncbi:TrmH family RNA methyltransferase [Nocardioides jejuensis]|uniref:rRNA methyltransferase n=1 Tax=Nocardioides jejuensis TaxID=2502782 RepID=A0A4V2NXN5_9ACTN|nr:TrmH family RNA methyltransferase [Nocardioides jejuensis]TCJ21932.1 rRNA methyltransferase [Nocardioides jejuensis]
MPHGPDEVGLGPWEGEWPDGPQWDPELLRDGDRRNVVDRYRYWTLEAIRADLDTRRHGFHVAIENWQHDFNIGTIVRSANAFLAAEVHIVGRKRWNRRGAMVTDRYQHIRHHETASDLADYLHALPEPVRLLGIDNLPGSSHLETMDLPRNVCFLFGQEGPGLSPGAREVCDGTFSIAQFGSTRSINASAAAAIAMHSWIRTYADLSAADGGVWRG